MTNIVPLLHKVLLKQDEVKSKKELDERLAAMPKGFVVAQEESLSEARRDQAASDYATVIAIGPTAYQDYRTDVPFKIGDRVVIARYAGKLVKDGDQEFLLVNDEDILATFKENTDA